MLEEKIKEAEQVLRLASEMSKTYYDAPLIICYSGGKDSDVLLDIAKRCLSPEMFEVMNSHTTVDAPETVYHIREVFRRCEENGIHTEIKYPTFKGERTSMWRLIEDKSIPPTRKVRYCCDILKETSAPNRFIAVGVREDESNGRKGRDAFASRGKRKDEIQWKSLPHTYAMFKLDQMGKEDAYECKFIRGCKEKKDSICNPIYKFIESDIWEYIRAYDVPTNPLYAKGYKRVGCIGCPLGGGKQMNREFRDYPIYKQNYIKAFDRMLAKRRAEGKSFLKCDLQTGEEVMRWWLGENPNQVRIEDILKGETE